MNTTVDMALLYESLLKRIYSIKSNDNSHHLNHGAYADLYRCAVKSMWNVDEFENEGVSSRKAFGYGGYTTKITVYISEAIHYVMEHQCKDDAGKRNELEELYRKASNAKSIIDIDNVISELCPIMGLEA